MVILIDIDGTLVPYENKYRHIYECVCGRRFQDSSLDKTQSVACPFCGGISFSRDEPSLEECRTLITNMLAKSLPPYPDSVAIINRLSLHHEVNYITTREEAFFEGTKAWLLGHRLPFKKSTQLVMREDNNRDLPGDLKGAILTRYRDQKEIIIIDDDLSLCSLADTLGLQFIWAPCCWVEGTYYGGLLQRVCGLKNHSERQKERLSWTKKNIITISSSR